ncbi:uncharacterized protein LOC113789745 [Dermatophagoides pteronyssinus]|uniref:Alpha-protein kinase 1-like n=2 Tax=Dermatophagoides pteronyssinus TaxID=6956 RepID=A0A6P6XT80_DERPT|nr:alpha-protein kinase 1-like [Dermatophagoides pteronyssinus]
MNRYRAMTYVLVVSNIIMLVAMFIAAFWGFTYPKIVVDGYESGKSAFVAAFMCCLAGICLCGLNFQNYYLLVTYAILHLLIMLNQLFSLLPFTWTRIPNYPLTGNVSTQVYVMLVPKIFLVAFAFALAYKLRRDEKRYELARTGGLHQRLPCHIVPRPEPGSCQSAPLNTGSMYHVANNGRTSGYGTNERGAPPTVNTSNHLTISQQPPSLPAHLSSHPLRMIPGTGGPPPGPLGQASAVSAPAIPPQPPLLPISTSTSTNQIIHTPPIYPLHRPSVTDVSSINSPNRPNVMSASCHRPIPVPANQCPSRIGNHSTSCGGLNDISTMIHDEQQQQSHLDQLSRTPARSSGVHWRPSSSAYHHQSAITAQQQQQQQQQQPQQSQQQQPPQSSMTPTKQWWTNTSAKQQQQYSSYYRDVYNPNF